MALSFLEQERGDKASPIIVDLMMNAARRKGWKPASRYDAPVPACE